MIEAIPRGESWPPAFSEWSSWVMKRRTGAIGRVVAVDPPKLRTITSTFYVPWLTVRWTDGSETNETLPEIRQIDAVSALAEIETV